MMVEEVAVEVLSLSYELIDQGCRGNCLLSNPCLGGETDDTK